MQTNWDLRDKTINCVLIPLCVITFGKGGSAMIKGFFSVQCLMLFVGIALGMSATADPWRVQKLPTRYAQLSLGTQPIDQTVYTYDTFGNGNVAERSEERRVGKECRSRWSLYQ